MLYDPLTCTCLNLRAASRRVSRRFDHIMAPAGLVGSQYSMLNFIAAKPACGVGELADWLDMDVSTVTRNLRPLQKDGHITIRSSVSDGRRREVRLTAKGRRALDRARPLWEDAQSAVIEELGERRWQKLLKLLKAIA